MAALTTTLVLLAIGSSALSAYESVHAGNQAKEAANKAGAAQDQAGKAQNAAAHSQAELSDYNAGIADLQAQDAIQRGAEEENKYRGQVRQIIGQQRAGQAAGNIDVSFGTAADVQADAAYLGELDALTVRTNARREAWGYQVQSYDLRKTAEIQRKEGANLEAAAHAGADATRYSGSAAQTAGYYNAANSLIGGTTSLLQMRYGFKSK